MNAKQLLLTAAASFCASAAVAYEPTEFVDPPSTRTREEVRAEIAPRLERAPTLIAGGEATVFVDGPAAPSARTWADVLAERRVAEAARDAGDYVGSV